MANGDVDMTSIIIAICVVIPAVIAISVCLIIFYSHRNKDRKFQRQISLSYEHHHFRERLPQDNHRIDYSRVNGHQQQRRIRELPPVIEQSPPSYNNSFNKTKRQQQLPLFSPVRTIPSTIGVHQASPIITPSIYSAMPPSYAEIFLSPHTLSNR